MTCPDLERPRIVNGQVGALINARDARGAVAAARQAVDQIGATREQAQEANSKNGSALHLALALCDLASALWAAGDKSAALSTGQQAINLAPSNEFVFHQVVTLLYLTRELRGRNFDAIRSLLAANSSKGAAWARNYRALMAMPTFINIEFVQGKCNLKCRMCLGVNAPTHPRKLSYISVDQFRDMLSVSPTIRGVTLSSGDSDPLLHPQIDEIVQVAGEHKVELNIYTNGLPLSERTCRLIVQSQSVSALNFSIDAATAETYAKIRGGNFERVRKNIGMLQDIKREQSREWPHLSMSFVAMADNIHELPAFVDMARELGALRVFVGDLIGWLGEAGSNYPATDNDRCFEYVQRARELAAEAGIQLQLPEQLANPPSNGQNLSPRVDSNDGLNATGASEIDQAVHASATENRKLPCCGWINGVWIDKEGSFDPCCLVHNVADMGNINDGPLYRNAKYHQVKDRLLEGKVFEACRHQRMCEYVQQQHAEGIPLRIIRADDVAQRVPAELSSSASNSGDTLVSLSVRSAV
jgi:MoaA/NifB/PqqE/SkfB family radical SAM enzyme